MTVKTPTFTFHHSLLSALSYTRLLIYVPAIRILRDLSEAIIAKSRREEIETGGGRKYARELQDWRGKFRGWFECTRRVLRIIGPSFTSK